MRTASITQTKNQLSALLDLVRRGETILILDRNRPVARLEPVGDGAGDEVDGRLANLERGGLLRRGTVPLPKDWTRGRRPRAKGDASALKALLRERRQAR